MIAHEGGFPQTPSEVAFDRKPLKFSESLGLLICDNFIKLHAAFAEHKILKVYNIKYVFLDRRPSTPSGNKSVDLTRIIIYNNLFQSLCKSLLPYSTYKEFI